MIIVMGPKATPEERENVILRIKELGYQAHLSVGVDRTVIGCVGNEDKSPLSQLEGMPGVEAAFPIVKPFKLVGREFHPENSVIDVDGVKVGGKKLTIIAGPCAVESREQILEVAQAVKESGAEFLRAATFNAQASPYMSQGLREKGLEYLAEARAKTGLKIISEIVSVNDLARMVGHVDMFQIGSRNCQNYALLDLVGQTQKPVILKRGMSTQINEFLMAAEYILAQGNYSVILCERGIRTFETATKFTLDLNAIPVIKRLSHLPLVVDPCQGTGKSNLVLPMARAAVAGGADGLILEVHPDPTHALIDGRQSVTPERYAEMIAEIRKIAEAVDRTI